MAYCGNTEGLAIHLGTSVRIAKPNINIAIFDGDYCHNVVMPYIAEEVSGALLLSSITGIKCMYRVTQALSVMGINTLSIASVPITSNLKGYIDRLSRGIDVIEIDSSLYRFVVLHLSLRLALELGGREIARIKRIERELDIGSIVNELIDRYIDKTLLNKKIGLVSITKSLLPAGEELIDRGIPIALVGRDKIENQPQVLIYTSVEEHIVNEYMVELSRKRDAKPDIRTVKINTDPLTAPLYALILFYAILL